MKNTQINCNQIGRMQKIFVKNRKRKQMEPSYVNRNKEQNNCF